MIISEKQVLILIAINLSMITFALSAIERAIKNLRK